MNFDAAKITELEKRTQKLLLIRDFAMFLLVVTTFIFMVTKPHLPLDESLFNIYAEIPKNVSQNFVSLGLLTNTKQDLNPWVYTNEFVLFDALVIMIFAAIYRRNYLFIAMLLVAAIPKSLFFTSVDYRIITFFIVPIIIYVLREQRYLAKINFIIRIILALLVYNVVLNLHYTDLSKDNFYTGEIIKVPTKANKDFDEKFQVAINSLSDETFSNEKNYILAQVSFIRGDFQSARNLVNNIKNDNFAVSKISKLRLKLFREFAIDGRVSPHNNFGQKITWLGYLKIIIYSFIFIIAILSQSMKNRIKRVSILKNEINNLCGYA